MDCLKIELMSSEESDTEEDKLIVRPLSWRSADRMLGSGLFTFKVIMSIETQAMVLMLMIILNILILLLHNLQMMKSQVIERRVCKDQAKK